MRSPAYLGLVVLVATALLSAGCYAPASGDQAAAVTSSAEAISEVPTATPVLVLPEPVILSVDTPTPGPEPTPTAPTATPIAAPTDREPVATPTAAPTATPASEATSVPTPVATPEATATPDLEPVGSPFTSAQLVSAITDRGLSYSPRGERDGCQGRAAEVRRLGGSDGPPVTLWVYETSDELKADWILPSSGAPRPTIGGCEVDSGWIYWYENLVMAFEPQDEWIPESSARTTIVESFFSLTR